VSTLLSRYNGVLRKFAQLVLKDHDKFYDSWPHGGEPILRNGYFVGSVTTSVFSYGLNTHVLIGLVEDIDPDTKQPRRMKDNEFINAKGVNWEVLIAGKKFRAKASSYPITIPDAKLGHMFVED